MIIYVSGKYRDISSEAIRENIRKARQVAIEIWKMGFFAICPHMNTSQFEEELELVGINGEEYVRRDLEIIGFCDAMMMVDNWETSEGAKTERAYAETLDIPIFISMEGLKYWVEYQRMSEEQEAHLHRVKVWFCRQVDKKYRAGQKEHGGNLWLKDNLSLLTPEIIDSVVYMQTIREQIQNNNFPPKAPLADKDDTCGRCGGIHLKPELCKGCED